MALYDRVWFATATTGTGTITVGAAVSGYRTPAGASIPNAGTFPYCIIDGSAWEIGNGTYTSAGTTVARSLVRSSTGALLSLTGNATMMVTPNQDTFVREVAGRVRHDANQSIANATPGLIVAFNTARRVNGVTHDNTSGAGKLIAIEAGWYNLTANVSFDSNATGFRIANLKINGTTYIAQDVRGAVNGNNTGLTVSTEWYFAVGDYVQLEVYQNSGGALNVVAASAYSPELQMVKQGVPV